MQKTLEINWEEIPQEYNYVAMDACGDVFAYINEPHIKFARTVFNDIVGVWIDEQIDSYELNTIENPIDYNWKILYERPSITDRDS